MQMQISCFAFLILFVPYTGPSTYVKIDYSKSEQTDRLVVLHEGSPPNIIGDDPH